MALDTMGLIGGSDVLQEISMRLEKSHLAYLQLDDSPLKLQARQKLEGFIKEYLCHAPNERKYVFQETAEILHRSAATVKDFSGYRACTAWRALSHYAANLLAQPWRKEYRTLRTYSGYYKHEIEANLIGAELMFELMGYKHTGLGVLILEGPIDPDRVSSVSRDAIVAFVECQILKEIWESVSQKFTVSWLEVLEFRCNSVGTSDQAVRALNFRFLERLHNSREKISSNSFRDYVNAPPPIGMESSIAALVPATIPYRVTANNYNTTILPNTCKPENVYPSDGHFYFGPMATVNRCGDPYVCGPLNNHYYPIAHATFGNSMGTSSASPGHATRVPTGRLIELDSPLPIGNYERARPVLNEISNGTVKSRIHEIDADQMDFRRDACVSADRHRDYARVEKRTVGKSSRDNSDAKNNDWEFVYRDLESRGYSKDHGERDDVLRRKELSLEAKNPSRLPAKSVRSLANVERDDEKSLTRCARDDKKRLSTGAGGGRINFNDGSAVHVDGTENRSRECREFRKKDFTDERDSFAAPGDSANDKAFFMFEKNGKKYSNAIPSSRNMSKSANETPCSAATTTMTGRADTTRDNKRREIGRSLVADRWNCGTCTFLNSYDREICEMCGKSRRKGNEDKPLASGGKECPQCTLVNEKNAATCEACNASLKDSPTYI